MKRSDAVGSTAGTPFGENLRGALAKRKMSQRALARKLGLNESNVCLWVRGKSFPRADQLPRIADALDVSLDELFGRVRTAGEKEKGTLRAIALTLIEDTHDIYSDLQALNKHARALKAWARKYGILEEDEE